MGIFDRLLSKKQKADVQLSKEEKEKIIMETISSRIPDYKDDFLYFAKEMGFTKIIATVCNINNEEDIKNFIAERLYYDDEKSMLAFTHQSNDIQKDGEFLSFSIARNSNGNYDINTQKIKNCSSNFEESHIDVLSISDAGVNSSLIVENGERYELSAGVFANFEDSLKTSNISPRIVQNTYEKDENKLNVSQYVSSKFPQNSVTDEGVARANSNVGPVIPHNSIAENNYENNDISSSKIERVKTESELEQESLLKSLQEYISSAGIVDKGFIDTIKVTNLIEKIQEEYQKEKEKNPSLKYEDFYYDHIELNADMLIFDNQINADKKSYGFSILYENEQKFSIDERTIISKNQESLLESIGYEVDLKELIRTPDGKLKMENIPNFDETVSDKHSMFLNDELNDIYNNIPTRGIAKITLYPDRLSEESKEM